MTFRFRSAEEAIGAIGRKLGPSDWLTIDQDRINLFAQATGDFQWLHVDPQRAARGPFGKTIAHGFLSLSLTNLFLPDLFMPDNLDWGVNYGLDRVRFPAPVPVGANIRASGELLDAKPIGENGVQTTVRMVIEVEGGDKPGCVADTLQRYAFL
ncbi:MaoC family dehydratase [Stappia stellulata]|uniref:MaoC family dehydratase n=1 Tax=Stappia stellulata TaxID=71235 RepID=UPI001CD3CC1F|nr:MaoC family dehydratase [Stappia stellulata]MCA1244195.1 MaoC family dehydratase [Stappia stellulata]